MARKRKKNTAITLATLAAATPANGIIVITDPTTTEPFSETPTTTATTSPTTTPTTTAIAPPTITPTTKPTTTSTRTPTTICTTKSEKKHHTQKNKSHKDDSSSDKSSKHQSKKNKSPDDSPSNKSGKHQSKKNKSPDDSPSNKLGKYKSKKSNSHKGRQRHPRDLAFDYNNNSISASLNQYSRLGMVQEEPTGSYGAGIAMGLAVGGIVVVTIGMAVLLVMLYQRYNSQPNTLPMTKDPSNQSPEAASATSVSRGRHSFFNFRKEDQQPIDSVALESQQKPE